MAVYISLTKEIFPAFFIYCMSCVKIGIKMISFNIAGYKTSAPISGATVNLYTTDNFNLNCVCWTSRLYVSKQTNQNGSCQVTETAYNNAIKGTTIKKDNYCPVFTDPTATENTNFALDSVGHVNIHLIKTNTYSGNNRMAIDCRGERLTSETCIAPIYSLTTDSLISFNVFGEQTNNIYWKFMTLRT
jgi:hypothetical protein